MRLTRNDVALFSARMRAFEPYVVTAEGMIVLRFGGGGAFSGMSTSEPAPREREVGPKQPPAGEACL